MAVEELTLLEDNAAPAVAIERRIVEIAADEVDELIRILGHAHRPLARDVHVVREAVVAPRRSHPLRWRFAVERHVDDRRIEDRRLDRNRRRDVDDDVAVTHGVGEVLLVVDRDVDGQAVAGLDGRPERLFDDDVRQALKIRVRAEIVPRVQADQNLRVVAPPPGGHGSNHHAQHVVVMRIQLPRRRRQRDEPARGVGADPPEERLARRHDVVAKVHVPLGRARDPNLFGRIAVQIDCLLLHQVVPDDEPVDTPHGKQLVREVVPA